MQNTIEQLVKKHYPNAKSGEEVTKAYLGFLKEEYKSDLTKMMFATSLCADDINVSTDFRRVLSRPFTLGGMGGLPFAGLTGITAFAHHVPDGGDAFIFYGPHIGITDDGVLGKMRRPGQKHLTNSCGALMLALERMRDKEGVYIPVNNEIDYQQTLLERSVMPFKHQILQAEIPEKEITEVTFGNIYSQVHDLVRISKNEFNCNRVFLLGCVIINTSPEFFDYVDVRTFETLDLKSLKEKELVSILQTEAFKNL
ncbi:hypothetical protein Pedsa_1416 [Pseudopedobacter saltans DSM 12145]|uniref:Limiting CO2-inducible protein B/C beta carbonyic anhydrase domain-containing protein n=1 Tax=Pseudopedobacter saltans (strain ATCC 51119 / DSM 12145 / JCM 21818 / CCUG 39354 / LMG 10337 / NBRC 100064 / NCIMB 13643) TaxID=762903 RepID=F0S4J0_PSESL|nr:hypothetical protein [Pseudopedobacter saltans]ADY51981.1 hypothetical protein Pedsa_1416 [Pseudopedobacter saltans DSM 12145]